MTLEIHNLVSVWCPDDRFRQAAEALAKALGLNLCDTEQINSPLYLQYQSIGLSLGATLADLGKPIAVDFVTGANAHRRKYGGGKQQDIARAVGISKKANLRVLDATAGLGRDGFVLASLGCHVTLLERNPVLYHLLRDGFDRASTDPTTAEVISRMVLVHADAVDYAAQDIDVVYLDPMFPPSQKSAKVKKELRYLHHVVGYDALGAEALFEWAFSVAKHRVVVKRPRLAPSLVNRQPALVFEGKSGRFDVYTKSAF